MAAAADAGTAQIDQKFLDKQSRTIGTYGLETMAKLISFKVLIVGCGGIGAETAKNLALAGIHTISLHDPRRPTLKDLGVNFAIAEDAIGKSKSIADLTASYISDLNPNTRVKAVTELTEAVIAKHTAVIFTTSAPDLSLKTLIKWNYFCRRHAPTISFILVTQTGAYGSIFVDHGDRFLVRDPTGQPPVQKAIESISTKTDKSGKEFSMVTFSTPDGQLGGMFEDYCKIQFTEVQGMVKKDGSSINGKTFDGVHCDGDPRFSVRFYPSFASQGFSEYKQGGFLKECPKPVELHCRPLEEALHSPGPIISAEAFSDGQSELRMHLQTHALLKFAEEKNGKTPSLHSTNDAQRVVTLVKEILEENRKRPVPSTSVVAPQRQNAEFPMLPTPPPVPVPAVVDALDEHIVLTEAMITEVELQPLACFFGAVAAQEVVKIAGKYSPINQWFHLSMEQVLPDKVDYTSAEYKPTGTRYDHLVSIFGKTFQDKLLNLRMFMIGCGALGCEDIKNFALCGLSCGPKGSIVITDNDRIEVSNLSRQFLFREDNVGQPKSVAAGKRIAFMNPKLKVNAMQEFVGPTTEHIFTDVFWEKLDVAVNALDNVEARVYVDSRCVTFNKVLVEGGTMGTGGSVDIIVPGQTTSYSDGSTAPSSQGGIPMCTLRNFPYIFEHCIEWSRAMFDDIFVAPFQKAVQIIDDSNDFVAKIMAEVDAAQSEGEKRSLVEKNMEPLKDLKRTLTTISQRPTMDDCAKLGWELLFKMFRDRILDLQSVFPKDAKKKNGDLFWSGHRKFPKAVEVDAARLASSPDAEAFLISTINLYACALGVHPTKHEPRYNDENNRWMAQYRSTQWIQSVANKLPVPKYIARQVEGLDEETAADAKPKEVRDLAAEEAELRQLLQELRDLATNCASAKCVPLEFEKDDDDNFQIDFIAAMSNLRATNYVIPTQDRMKVKLTAGKIIPAIATTTSAVAALGLIELFKVLQNKSIDDLRAGMLELGTNYYVLFSRDPPIKYRTSVTETFLPEQGITWKKKTIRVPNNHSKYDFIDIPITPKTTVKEVADAILPHLNATLPAGVDYEYEIDGFGVGKGMIWNGRPSHANTNVPIMKAIETQKKSEVSGELPKPFWEQRTQFCDLSVAVSVDDGDDSVDDVEVIPAPIRLLIRQ